MLFYSIQNENNRCYSEFTRLKSVRLFSQAINYKYYCKIIKPYKINKLGELHKIQGKHRIFFFGTLAQTVMSENAKKVTDRYNFIFVQGYHMTWKIWNLKKIIKPYKINQLGELHKHTRL